MRPPRGELLREQVFLPAGSPKWFKAGVTVYGLVFELLSKPDMELSGNVMSEIYMSVQVVPS